MQTWDYIIYNVLLALHQSEWPSTVVHAFYWSPLLVVQTTSMQTSVTQLAYAACIRICYCDPKLTPETASEHVPRTRTSEYIERGSCACQQRPRCSMMLQARWSTHCTSSSDALKYWPVTPGAQVIWPVMLLDAQVIWIFTQTLTLLHHTDLASTPKHPFFPCCTEEQKLNDYTYSKLNSPSITTNHHLDHVLYLL